MENDNPRPKRYWKTKTSPVGKFKYSGKKDKVCPGDFSMIFVTVTFITAPTLYYMIKM